MKKILIVDDTLERVIVIERVLADFDLSFVRCTDLKQVTDLKEEERFNLIIISLQRGELDGLDIADRLRKISYIKDIPIIFISLPIKDEDFLVRIYERELVDLIVTPIIPEVLRSKVNTYLRISSFFDKKNV